MDLFLLEGAVTEGGATPVRDQADGVPRFTKKKQFNSTSSRVEIGDIKETPKAVQVELIIG